MSTTYTQIHGVGVKAACTTGSEAAPTSTDDSEGLDIRNCESVMVHIEAAAAMTAGGKLLAYVFNRFSGAAGRWNPCPDLDIIVSAVQYAAHPGLFASRAGDRITFVPSGVGQAVSIYMLGATK